MQDLLKQEKGTDESELAAQAAAFEESEKYLTFYVDNQLFAMPSSHVVDIISMTKITYIPHLPPFVKGVTNVRGKIVPLIELRMKFNKESQPYDERTCIIITDTNECSVGYIVDKVNDVTDVSKSQISPPPHITDYSANYISGVAKVNSGIALVLDVGVIIEESELHNGIHVG